MTNPASVSVLRCVFARESNLWDAVQSQNIWPLKRASLRDVLAHVFMLCLG